MQHRSQRTRTKLRHRTRLFQNPFVIQGLSLFCFVVGLLFGPAPGHSRNRVLRSELLVSQALFVFEERQRNLPSWETFSFISSNSVLSSVSSINYSVGLSKKYFLNPTNVFFHPITQAS